MARINVDEKWFVKDPRRKKFIKAVGDEDKADGIALKFWLVGQEAHANGKLVNKKLFKMMAHSKDFLDCELAEDRPDGIYIKGSKRRAEFLKAKIEAGRKGGQVSSESKAQAAREREDRKRKARASTEEKPTVSTSKTTEKAQTTSKHEPHAHSQVHSHSHAPSQDQAQIHFEDSLIPDLGADAPSPPKRKRTKNDNPEQQALRRACWESYKTAYIKRWHKEPVRNATVNAQIGSLAGRLGKDTPEVLDFYVRHSDSFYVKNCHPLGLCLKNAEGLHTQWANKRAITSTDMRQHESNQHYSDQIGRFQRGES